MAAEVIPPKPTRYFNDYARVVPPAVADQLNGQLENLEKTSGNQVLVAVYPAMQSESSIDDYTLHVARAWQVGQKQVNNGAVLFVFINDRKMFIQTGYGLEGPLPDALCKQITEYEIKPRFRAGDYAGGLSAGVNAIIAATKGEYKGTGQTLDERRLGHNRNLGNSLIFIVIAVFILLSLLMPRGRRNGWVIGSGGWGGFYGGGWGGGWGGGGGGSSGGGGGGGGGGFTSGGGSFGGGGAGSSW